MSFVTLFGNIILHHRHLLYILDQIHPGTAPLKCPYARRQLHFIHHLISHVQKGNLRRYGALAVPLKRKS